MVRHFSFRYRATYSDLFMNRSSKAWYLCIYFSILFGAGARADKGMDQKWQEVRDHQPPGLQMKLILPKDHFFQGEEINGTIEFANNSPAPYYLWAGSASRFGRASGIAFFAESTSGDGVIDPLAWIWNKVDDMGMNGMGTFKDLGTWSITLPTAYWLRFDKPGTYTLYVWSDRAQAGDQPKPGVQGQSPTHVQLVSDRITITIDPLTPEQEEQTLAEAKVKLATTADRGEGALELNALQTPSARDALRPLLDDKDNSGASNVASTGLMEAPDLRAEATLLFADVSQGKLAVNGAIQWAYSWTKTYGMPDGSSTVPYAQQTPAMQEELANQRLAWSQALASARQEILDAAEKATGGSGPAYVQTLWTAFMGNRLDPQARAAVVAHQLELSQENKDRVLREWFFELRESHRVHPPGYSSVPMNGIPRWGGEDFLPLVREALAVSSPAVPVNVTGGQLPPLTREEKQARYERQQMKDYALVILANLKPDEARPLIIEDIRRPDPQFFFNGFPLWGDSSIVPTLPLDPMPELDSAFREKLAAKNRYLFALMPLIDRYGSTNLVPDVLRVYTPQEGRNNSTVRDALLQYLQRSDPSKVDGISNQ
jgi:hypothetical protein